MSSLNSVENSTLLKTTLWFINIGLVLFFLVYFKSLLQTFVLSVVIWFLIKSLRDWTGTLKIARKPLPDWLRGAIAFLIVLAVLAIIIEILILNANAISRKIPLYSAKIDRFFQELKSVQYFAQLSQGLEEGISFERIQRYIGSVLGSISSLLGNLVYVIIYVVFLMIEEGIFEKKMQVLVPQAEKRNQIMKILSHINYSVKTYLSVKTAASLLTGFLGYWVLVLFGVDFPFLWAFLLFLLNYIPYLGSLIATLLPSIFVIFQQGSMASFIYVFLTIEAIQLSVGSFLEPKIMGETLNLSPLIVILALVLWGGVWGVLGMMLAVPITSIIVIILSQFPSTQKIAIALSEGGKIGK